MGYLINHILTSAILILMVILLRLVLGKRISQRIRYALWILVAFKLILPLPIGNVFNVSSVWDKQINASGEQIAITDKSLSEYDSSTIKNDVKSTDDLDIVSFRQDSDATDKKGKESIEDSSEALVNNNRNFVRPAVADYAKKSVHTDLNESDSSYTDKKEASEPKEVGQPAGPYRGTDLSTVLFLIWMIGCAVCAGTLVGANILHHRRIFKNREKVGEYNKLSVYISDAVATPCLFGMMKPAIYFPDISFYENEVSEYILLHEYTHYKHLDMFWSFLRCVCISIYWFNPFVWWASALSKRDSELACDEGVAKRLSCEERKNYCLTLIEMCERVSCGQSCSNRLRLSTEMLGGNNEIKNRISSIAGYTRQKKALVSVVLAAAVVLVGCTYGVAAGVKEETKKNDASEAASGSAVTAAAVDRNVTDLDINVPETYYTTHSEEEIRADVETQLKLIAKKKDEWVQKDNSKRNNPDYMISDLDQDGKLEIAATWMGDFDGKGGYSYNEKVLEVSDDNASLNECKVSHKEGTGDTPKWWENGDFGIVQKSIGDVYREGDHFFYPKNGRWYNADISGKSNEINKTDKTHGPTGAYDDSGYLTTDAPHGQVYFHEFNIGYNKQSIKSENDSEWKTEEDIFSLLMSDINDFRIYWDDDRDNYTLFREYISALEKDQYIAVVNIGRPVLLVADGDKVMNPDKYGVYSAGAASIYVHNAECGMMEELGHISSSGLGYPLIARDHVIAGGFHHSSERYTMHGDALYQEKLDGISLDGKTAVTYSAGKMYNSEEEKTIVSQKIPATMGDSLDFYMDVNDGGCVIEFMKVSEYEKYERVDEGEEPNGIGPYLGDRERILTGKNGAWVKAVLGGKTVYYNYVIDRDANAPFSANDSVMYVYENNKLSQYKAHESTFVEVLANRAMNPENSYGDDEDYALGMVVKYVKYVEGTDVQG